MAAAGIDWDGHSSVAARGRYRWTGLVPRPDGVAVGEPGADGEVGLSPCQDLRADPAGDESGGGPEGL